MPAKKTTIKKTSSGDNHRQILAAALRDDKSDGSQAVIPTREAAPNRMAVIDQLPELNARETVFLSQDEAYEIGEAINLLNKGVKSAKLSKGMAIRIAVQRFLHDLAVTPKDERLLSQIEQSRREKSIRMTRQ